ncbi:MAG: porin [Rhodospirillaceae bacterium]
MKGFLLAGCAAIALVGFCTAATAETAPGKFDINLSGDAFIEAGYVNQSNDGATNNGNTKNFDLINRFRLTVNPEAKADNGLTYGAKMRMRAYWQNGTIDGDQAYVYVNGTFGNIEAGVQQNPNYQFYVIAPNSFGTGGIDGDWVQGSGWITNQGTFMEPYFGGGFNNVTNSTMSTRVNYFTPRFFGSDEKTGLMGMVSYAPNNLDMGTAVNRSRTINNSNPLSYNNCGQNALPAGSTTIANNAQGCAYQNIYEVGVRYDGNLGPVSVSTSLGYQHGDAQTNVLASGTRIAYNDLESYQAGVQFGYAGFLVGGSYMNAGKSAYAKSNSGLGALSLSDQSTWTAGISYETGPVIVGFNYAHGEDAGDITVPGSRSGDMLAVGAIYTLAPGMTTSIEWIHSTTDNERGFGTDPMGYSTVAGSGNADVFLWRNMVTF